METPFAHADVRTCTLESVVISNYGSFLRYVRGRGAGDDAEDIIQELWMKARDADRARTTELITEPRAFLCRMARNLVLDNRRARMRRENRDTHWSDCNNAHGCTPKSEPLAERSLMARQELTAVVSRLDGLGERAAAIFRPRAHVPKVLHRHRGRPCARLRVNR